MNVKLALALAAGFAVGWYLARRYAPQSTPAYNPATLLGIKI